MSVFRELSAFIQTTFPWWGLPLLSFTLCLLLTPLVRSGARWAGMVDEPSARRINKTPIPRGGGLALFLSVTIPLICYICLIGGKLSPFASNVQVLRLLALSGVLVCVGLADDKWALAPKLKLLAQIAVASGVYFWCGVGFRSISFLQTIPPALDAVMTIFWITGAVNAFNLIDGLDGLATGLALIGALGMGGALFFIGYPHALLVYLTLAAACLAFLRYNFYPASIFLGDTGSMYLGFMLGSCPLLLKASDSFFVSVGVPILAMSVPIFDTSLAIVRRLIRALLHHEEAGRDEGNTHVMQADVDHLHHRLLRAFSSQTKTACTLYLLSGFFVLVGFCALALRDRAAGLFMLAFIVAIVIIARDMRRVELWDLGRLLNVVAHEQNLTKRHRWHMLAMPFSLGLDLITLATMWLLLNLFLHYDVNTYAFHTALPLRLVPIFFCLVCAHTYTTAWARAQISNYLRLSLAVFIGTIIGSAAIILLHYPHSHLLASSLLYFMLCTSSLIALRLIRPIARDLFYALDSSRLLARNPSLVSRLLVYGGGLRYRAFRRELVRSSSQNTRAIVGIIDDDPLLKGLRIGGIHIWGSLNELPQICARTHAQALVITCVLSRARLARAKELCASLNLKLSVWRMEEDAL